jgi:hypothetical protein
VWKKNVTNKIFAMSACYFVNPNMIEDKEYSQGLVRDIGNLFPAGKNLFKAMGSGNLNIRN